MCRTDADAVRFIEDEDEDDASVRGEDDDDDEPEEVVAWCSSPECQCLSTFAYDQNTEEEPGPDDPNLICGFCGCAIDPDQPEQTGDEGLAWCVTWQQPRLFSDWQGVRDLLNHLGQLVNGAEWLDAALITVICEPPEEPPVPWLAALLAIATLAALPLARSTGKAPAV